MASGRGEGIPFEEEGGLPFVQSRAMLQAPPVALLCGREAATCQTASEISLCVHIINHLTFNR